LRGFRASRFCPPPLLSNTNDNQDFQSQRLPISQRKWCDDISTGLWKRLLVFSAPKLGWKVEYRNLQKCMRDLCFLKWPSRLQTISAEFRSSIQQLNRGKWGTDLTIPRMPRHTNSSRKRLRRGGYGGENRNNDA